MCNDCFFLFPKKLRTDRCPACTLHITHFDVLSLKQLSEEDVEANSEAGGGRSRDDVCDFFFSRSSGNSYADLVAQQAEQGYLGQDELIADCLDHSYFLEELKKLLQMASKSEDELFKRRVPTRRGTEEDRECLAHIRERALDL